MAHTHTGTCQICERRQAVNVKTGRIAKHGYTVDWGFFSGTCPGSDHLPYEKSCDLIPAVIVSLNGRVEDLKAGRAKTEAVESPRGGFEFRRYVRNPRTWRHGYESHEVTGRFEDYSRPSQHDDYTFQEVRFVADKPVKFSDGNEYSETTTQDWTGKERNEVRINGRYGMKAADYAAAWKASELAQYDNLIDQTIKFREHLERRVAEWKLRDLKPVKEVA